MSIPLDITRVASAGGMGVVAFVAHELRGDCVESDGSDIGAVTAADGSVYGVVRLSPAMANRLLPTVHEERGVLNLEPLKSQMTDAMLGDLLLAMAASHDGAG